MDLYSRIVQKSDVEEIYDYESKLLDGTNLDEHEKMLFVWSSRWRKEALDHYFNLGWSFLIRDKSQKSLLSDEGLLLGYFIAQPLVFFDGQTQSLWIEHIRYTSENAKNSLIELAVRLGKEKHFQRVFFPEDFDLEHNALNFKKEDWNPKSIFIKTTRSK